MESQKQQRSTPTWVSIIKLLRWDQPTGRLILMIPALWAVFLAARGAPPLPLVSVIVLGTLATSAGGCVINDLWDRDIDPLVQRTRNRPIASRALSVKIGLAIAAIAFACAWILSLYLTPLSFWLCVAAVPVIIFYPLAKRVFPLPQLILSIAWGFAVLISWTAATGRLEFSTWLLWGATVLWTLGFDTVYALSDQEFDRRIGVKSSALFFGDWAAQAVGLFFIGTVLMLAWLGVNMGLDISFWVTLGIAAVIWAWQYRQLSRRHPPKRIYGQVFRQNVGLGFVLLVGMILSIKP